jgi:rfaE bifunctional protein nucleotidyltransferase chain/domain
MKNAKICPISRIGARLARLRRSGKTIVATNGCFDLLHPGHVRYLQQAKKLGDVLVVGLNGDRSVRALKGKNRPLIPQNGRAEVLAALEAVDFVVIFPEKRATNFLKKVCPDVYVKGGDYKMDTLHAEECAALAACGAKIKILPLVAGYSTTKLLQKF